MKKWQFIAGLSAIAAGILFVLGIVTYRYMVVPKVVAPVVNKFDEYVKKDSVLTKLYDEAVNLHDEGVMTDSTYTSFITTYNKHMRNDEEFAHEILDSEVVEEDNKEPENTTISAKYASKKVGVNLIQSNDSEEEGKAAITYSSERTSTRVKAEDRVEAEKIIAEEETTTKPTEEPSDVQSAYKKLQEHMSASEYSSFISIMSKLDTGTLQGFMNGADKEGLKEYLHSKLDDDSYSKIVNLGYKYVNLFIDE